MNTLELIKAIFHGVNFYWKKFLIFSLFAVLIVSGTLIWKSQSKTEASLQFSQVPQYATLQQQTMNIEVQENGKVYIDGKENSDVLKIFPDYYEVRILVLDNPGVFIGSFIADMHLPAPVEEGQYEQLIYAVHGVGSYNAYQADNQDLVYQAENIASTSTLTIAAHLPKNILKAPLGKRIVYNITNVPAREYLFIALTLPGISLLVMLFMIIKRRKDQIVSLNAKPADTPPAKISPAIAGVLIDGQVGNREIAATLIDLACRGYIFVIKKGKTFSFGKRKSMNLENLPELKEFEKKLLSKIFESEDYRSTKDDVEMRVGRHIFSKKIAESYLAIYQEATSLGYYVKNPAQIHRRWKYTGIVLFFVGLLGFVHSAFFAPDPKFTLIFWAGEMLASSLIIKFSGLMPARSAQGSAALNQWMAFRNYLKLKKPIEPGANISNRFIDYLPYAIVYGVEVEWAKRFFNEPYIKPDWYDSTEPVSTLESFAGGLFPLIGFVGKLLDKSHDPRVE